MCRSHARNVSGSFTCRVSEENGEILLLLHSLVSPGIVWKTKGEAQESCASIRRQSIHAFFPYGFHVLCRTLPQIYILYRICRMAFPDLSLPRFFIMRFQFNFLRFCYMRLHIVATKTVIRLESKRMELCTPKKLKSFEKEEACRFFDTLHRLG